MKGFAMETEKKWKFSVYRTISTVAICATFFLVINDSGMLLAFVDLPSAVLVLGVSFFLTLGTYQGDFVRFIPASLMVLFFNPVRPNRRFAEIARFSGRYVIGSAVVVYLITLVMMLQHLGDPAGIGRGMAIAILPILYAVGFSEFFLAVVYRAFRPTRIKKPPRPLGFWGIGLVIAVTMAVIIYFMILLASFMDWDDDVHYGEITLVEAVSEEPSIPDANDNDTGYLPPKEMIEAWKQMQQ